MPEAPAPDAFQDTFVAMTAARAIITATRLGVMASLAHEPAGSEQLARRLSLELAGVEALLSALKTLGYLEADEDGAYRPTAAGLQLVPGATSSVAHFVGAYNAYAWEMLGRLDEVLADARVAGSHRRSPGDPFWESYIRGLFELSRHELDANAALVPVSDPRRMLDVAGGHGGFAIAMCRRFDELQATVLDLPASVAIGRRIVSEEGFESRVRFREGDALAEALGEELDVVSMLNLLHHLPERAIVDLLGRARAALRAGGYLVIGETERPEPGQPPTRAGALSALVYFVSSGTRNYTRTELTAWLRRAGFANVEVRRSEHSPWRLVYLAEA